MNFKKKNALTLLFLFQFFILKEVLAIHHHPRFPINFLEGSIFLGKKRLIVLNVPKNKILKLKKEVEDKKCEIENRKLIFLYKKKNEYFYVINNKIENSIKYILPYNISLIGIDGFLKYSNKEIESLEKYFLLIDQMPLREKEKEYDKPCD